MICSVSSSGLASRKAKLAGRLLAKSERMSNGGGEEASQRRLAATMEKMRSQSPNAHTPRVCCTTPPISEAKTPPWISQKPKASGPMKSATPLTLLRDFGQRQSATAEIATMTATTGRAGSDIEPPTQSPHKTKEPKGPESARSRPTAPQATSEAPGKSDLTRSGSCFTSSQATKHATILSTRFVQITVMATDCSSFCPTAVR